MAMGGLRSGGGGVPTEAPGVGTLTFGGLRMRGAPPPPCQWNVLRDDVLDHVAVYISQAVIAALEAVG